jgi:hypothetical protein
MEARSERSTNVALSAVLTALAYLIAAHSPAREGMAMVWLVLLSGAGATIGAALGRLWIGVGTGFLLGLVMLPILLWLSNLD